MARNKSTQSHAPQSGRVTKRSRRREYPAWFERVSILLVQRENSRERQKDAKIYGLDYNYNGSLYEGEKEYQHKNDIYSECDPDHADFDEDLSELGSQVFLEDREENGVDEKDEDESDCIKREDEDEPDFMKNEDEDASDLMKMEDEDSENYNSEDEGSENEDSDTESESSDYCPNEFAEDCWCRACISHEKNRFDKYKRIRKERKHDFVKIRERVEENIEYHRVREDAVEYVWAQRYKNKTPGSETPKQEAQLEGVRYRKYGLYSAAYLRSLREDLPNALRCRASLEMVRIDGPNETWWDAWFRFSGEGRAHSIEDFDLPATSSPRTLKLGFVYSPHDTKITFFGQHFVRVHVPNVIAYDGFNPDWSIPDDVIFSGIEEDFQFGGTEELKGKFKELLAEMKKPTKPARPRNQSTNQPTNPSTNPQFTKQSSKQSSKQSTKPLSNQTPDPSRKQPTKQSKKQSTKQSTLDVWFKPR
ncbi:hypothetical protein K491DRAFT_774820 [Lophiostoma macrostomum CBS 122681]|uniref:Uncharacterized protein n=1 Tax=Lophiostoma macrostomum CBS 122681 TaxID=1314788 RepID=A0A6A6TP13_9PLEO|nr:hypothetical protein K491DRAFT_774820 [Lophiostoma macrostomum CBS 122681]